MNEQIRELAKQAGIFYYRKGQLQVDTETFAKLMVTECKSVLLDMMNDSNRDMDTLDIALTMINDKFGIEE